MKTNESYRLGALYRFTDHEAHTVTVVAATDLPTPSGCGEPVQRVWLRCECSAEFGFLFSGMPAAQYQTADRFADQQRTGDVERAARQRAAHEAHTAARRTRIVDDSGMVRDTRGPAASAPSAPKVTIREN